MSLLDQIQLNKSLPTHKDFSKMIKKMNFWEESLEVTEEYYETEDPTGQPILKKFTCEEEADFKFRASIASPRNYLKGILGKYLATIFKTSPERTENEFSNNVDLLGSTMDEFMQMKTYEASVYGASYMMPDSTATDPYLSEAQKRQIGVRPFIRSIPTENVVNWVDYLGHLQEAVVIFEGQEETHFAMWYSNELMCRIELDKNGKVTSIGEVEQLPYPFIPVVRLLPQDTEESFMAPGSLYQMSLNNLLSLEKTELFSNTFTRFFATGIRTNNEDQGMTKLTWGTNRLIIAEEQGASITPLGADPAQAQSIRDSIKAEEDALHRHYHLSSTQVGEAQQVPSGYSLVISKQDFNAVCLQFVKAIERCEKQLAELFNATEGLGLDAGVYSRNFIEPSKSEDILNLRDVLALPIDEDMKAQEIAQFRKKYYVE